MILASTDNFIPSKMTSSKLKKAVCKSRTCTTKQRNPKALQTGLHFTAYTEQYTNRSGKLIYIINDVLGASLESQNMKPFLEVYKGQGQHTFGIATLSSSVSFVTKLEDKVKILSKQFKSVVMIEDTSTQSTLDMPCLSDMPPIVISTHFVEQCWGAFSHIKRLVLTRSLQGYWRNVHPVSLQFWLTYSEDYLRLVRANIFPVFKKVKPDDSVNYGPISNLHHIKVAEAHCP